MTTVKVKLGKAPMRLLRQLHESGLYGFTLEQTVEHLVLEGLRKRLLEKDYALTLGKTQEGRKA